MDVAHQLVHIFVEVDDFCKQLENYNYDGRLLGDSQTKRPRGPRCGLSDSEIMTLLMAFQRGRFRDFKSFYFFYYPALCVLFSWATELSEICGVDTSRTLSAGIIYAVSQGKRYRYFLY